MKIIGVLIGFLGIAFAFSACSNELDLTAPWKDVPIVYGMLSPGDSAQYIRVEKAFIDPKKNALTFTGNPDSIYYQNADVSLVLVSTGQTFPLHRVDGNLEGYPRNPGIWAQAPNYLYKIKTSEIDFIPGQEYQLVIHKGDGLPTTKATTKLIGKPEILQLKDGDAISINGNISLVWATSTGADLYDASFVFNYEENTENAPDTFTPKSITWKAAVGLRPKNSNPQYKTKSFKGSNFMKYIKLKIPQNDHIKRHFLSMEVIITAGGEEISRYYDVKAANQGITGSEVLISYSNIPDGYGIFSSLSKDIVADLHLTHKSLDSLKTGQYTGKLNFE